jgi:hypothetical protein
MARDILQQLAELEVPQAPADLVQQVHDRLNERLTLLHFVEYAVKAMPAALLHFLSALTGLARFTLTGKYGDSPRRADGD